MVPTSVTVTEGGDAEYTVRLATEPTATVTVTITGHSGTDLTLDPSSARLTFTTSNWNTVQTVTMAAEDGDRRTTWHAGPCGLGRRLRLGDGEPLGRDTDTAGLVVPTSVTVTEGGDAEYGSSGDGADGDGDGDDHGALGDGPVADPIFGVSDDDVELEHRR